MEAAQHPRSLRNLFSCSARSLLIRFMRLYITSAGARMVPSLRYQLALPLRLAAVNRMDHCYP
jgi:hypothetical protein